MGGRIGRKSVFSQEIANIDYINNQYKKVSETLHCLVLDVCGAHNPTTKFLNGREFKTGIYLIVGIEETGSIAAVYWNKCYDYLRSLYGTDENIIGRRCVVETASRSSWDIEDGCIEFREGKRNKYSDESRGTYVSLSSICGISQNHEIQIKNYEENQSEGIGEIWHRFEK